LDKEKKARYDKKYHREHKEYYSKNHKKWESENKEHLKEYRKKWREKNNKYCEEYHKKWKENNPEYGKKYYKANKKRASTIHKRWLMNHPKYKNHINLLERKRRTDSKYNLNKKIKHAIYKSLKGNKAGRHWENLVGYKLKDLMKRLKETMPKGFNWQNYVEGELHIDHIIPISIFNFTKSEHPDFKRCWALDNLQLLPAKENLSKHNKFLKPFQPSLKI
jgi:hypothetical protein